MEPQLSPLQRRRRSKLVAIRKELLSRNPALKVLVHHIKLLVD